MTNELLYVPEQRGRDLEVKQARTPHRSHGCAKRRGSGFGCYPRPVASGKMFWLLLAHGVTLLGIRLFFSLPLPCLVQLVGFWGWLGNAAAGNFGKRDSETCGA